MWPNWTIYLNFKVSKSNLKMSYEIICNKTLEGIVIHDADLSYCLFTRECLLSRII